MELPLRQYKLLHQWLQQHLLQQLLRLQLQHHNQLCKLLYSSLQLLPLRHQLQQHLRLVHSQELPHLGQQGRVDIQWLNLVLLVELTHKAMEHSMDMDKEDQCNNNT